VRRYATGPALEAAGWVVWPGRAALLLEHNWRVRNRVMCLEFSLVGAQWPPPHLVQARSVFANFIDGRDQKLGMHGLVGLLRSQLPGLNMKDAR
jgi:hypothetical protein